MFRLYCGVKSPLKLVFLTGRNMSIAPSDRGPAGGDQSTDNRSIHSDTVEEVHNIPMQVIIRPFPPVLDEQKVQSLMDTIRVTRLFYVIICLWMMKFQGKYWPQFSHTPL